MISIKPVVPVLFLSPHRSPFPISLGLLNSKFVRTGTCDSFLLLVNTNSCPTKERKSKAPCVPVGVLPIPQKGPAFTTCMVVARLHLLLRNRSPAPREEARRPDLPDKSRRTISTRHCPRSDISTEGAEREPSRPTGRQSSVPTTNR